MSGGALDYISYKIEDLRGKMHDPELDLFVVDFARLCHDLEWWLSADTCAKDYYDALAEFKKKWFGKEAREARLKELIIKETEATKRSLLRMIGEDVETTDEDEDD